MREAAGEDGRGAASSILPFGPSAPYRERVARSMVARRPHAAEIPAATAVKSMAREEEHADYLHCQRH